MQFSHMGDRRYRQLCLLWTKKNFITSVGLNNQETAWINGEILLVGAMADSFYFSDRNGSIREKAFQRL